MGRLSNLQQQTANQYNMLPNDLKDKINTQLVPKSSTTLPQLPSGDNQRKSPLRITTSSTIFHTCYPILLSKLAVTRLSYPSNIIPLIYKIQILLLQLANGHGVSIN